MPKNTSLVRPLDTDERQACLASLHHPTLLPSLGLHLLSATSKCPEVVSAAGPTACRTGWSACNPPSTAYSPALPLQLWATTKTGMLQGPMPPSTMRSAHPPPSARRKSTRRTLSFWNRSSILGWVAAEGTQLSDDVMYLYIDRQVLMPLIGLWN